MPIRRRRMPRDPNELAHAIGRLVTGDTPKVEPEEAPKNPAAVELGRRGGLKGGKARARRLSADELSAAARRAAQSRWKRNKKG